MRALILFCFLLPFLHSSHSHYGSIPQKSVSMDDPGTVDDYSVMRGSLSVSEQIGNISRCELVIDGLGFTLMSVLAFISKSLCSGETSWAAVLFLGFPLVCLMTWESAMAAFLAHMIYSLEFQFMDMPTSYRRALKVTSVLAVALSAAKWLALVIPSARGSAMQDFCADQGLWCEPRWLLGEIIPSVAIFGLVLTVMLLNERVADRNKEAKYTV